MRWCPTSGGPWKVSGQSPGLPAFESLSSACLHSPKRSSPHPEAMALLCFSPSPQHLIPARQCHSGHLNLDSRGHLLRRQLPWRDSHALPAWTPLTKILLLISQFPLKGGDENKNLLLFGMEGKKKAYIPTVLNHYFIFPLQCISGNLVGGKRQVPSMPSSPEMC